MGEWKTYKLGDVIDKFIDYRGKTPPKTDSGIPLITAKVVKDGRILEPTEFIAEDYYTQWMTRGYPEINDVVLTTEAPLGEVALLRDNKVALAQRIITLRGKKELCDNVFLKYYLQSNIGQATLQARAQGSTVEGIKSAELREVEVSLPPLPEQKSIASVLSSLDDKIDLLHRQNKTLEALAETLFRQWFVEEAEEGWAATRIGDVARINGASIDKNYPYAEIEYLDTGSITDGIVTDYQRLNLKDAPSRAKRIVQNNDVIISMVRPIQRHYGILKKTKPNTVASTGFCVITATQIDPHFIYLLLTQEDMTEYLEIIAEGSTTAYPSLTYKDIENVEFLLPPKKILDAFSEIASVSWKKIEENRDQIRTLARLRDTLLPKLLNGEVKV